MTPHEMIRSLDELIERRSILRHPFYVAWERGDLNGEQLATYASFYYPHVAAFPGYLKAASERASDDVIREELERNLADELGQPVSHDDLWLDFAGGLGLNRATVASAAPRPAAARIVSTFDRLARGETAGALAAFYAYESQQPEVSERKIDGLRRHYGVTSPRSLAYFVEHASADIAHSEGERQALMRCVADGASHQCVVDAAGEALDAYWGLLDGVCEEAGISTH